MKLDPRVVSVLDRSTVDGNKLYLPPETLERSLYLAVAKAIDALGGKWTGRLGKGGHHLFEGDPREAIEQAIASGKLTNRRQELGFFETPTALARQLVEWADIRPGHDVLEPSAGRGAIADVIMDALSGDAALMTIELDPLNHAALVAKGYTAAYQMDFLTAPQSWSPDRIVANPPFGKSQRDIDHVRHMFTMLRPGGRLVSVMAEGVMWRDNRKSVEFRELVELNDGSIEPLPEGSFKASGTDVNTCVVILDKAVA